MTDRGDAGRPASPAARARKAGVKKAPVRKATPVRKAPVRKTAAVRKTVAAKKAAVVRKAPVRKTAVGSAPVKRTATVSRAPARKATPVRKAAPVRKMAPVTRVPVEKAAPAGDRPEPVAAAPTSAPPPPTPPDPGWPAPAWPPPSPPPWAPPPASWVPGPPAREGLATAAMIAGIVSIPLVITVVGSALVGFGAVVVAIAALSRIRAHPERSGRGMAITGLVTGVVGLGLTILFVIALSGDDDTNELDTVEYTELSPGDCFERSPAFPSGVALEDCRFAHDREVVGVVEHPASFDAPFPGRRALDDRARELCLPLFEDYLGPDREAAIVALETLQPTPSAWGEGNRRIVCAVERTDDEKLVGSVKDGSGPFRY